MYQRIVVGMDGSLSSEKGLGAALAIARRAQAEIRLIHVLDVSQSAYVDSHTRAPWTTANPDRNAREYLERFVLDISTRWSLRVSYDVMNGDAADQLVKAADRPGTDLLVVTSHGRGPFERFWLGSVADRVMREATSPVLLVPAATASASSERIGHILSPLDGSRLAEHALDGAASLAEFFGARLTLLRVVELAPPLVGFPGGEGVFPVATSDIAAIKESAVAYLEKVVVTRELLAPVVATDVVVETGSVASRILNYAAEHDVDLIALASHGEGGIRRLLLGSVADKLIRAGQVSVLIHNPQEPASVHRDLPPSFLSRRKYTNQ